MPGRGYGINQMSSLRYGELFTDVEVIKSTILTTTETLLGVNERTQNAKELADKAIADTVAAIQTYREQMDITRNTIIERIDSTDERIGGIELGMKRALTDVQLSASRHESALADTSTIAIQTKQTVTELVKWRDAVAEKLERITPRNNYVMQGNGEANNAN